MTSIETETFRLTYDDEPGRVIRGRVFVPPLATEEEQRPAVIVLHGFKGFMDWGFFPELGRTLAERGFFAVTFNMSGSGVGEAPLEMDDHGAFERNTPSRELEDLDRVRAHLESGALPGVDPARPGLLGHSLGGGMALLSAARRGDYRAVVAWSAISRADRFDQETARRWREQGFLEVPNARTGQVHRLGLGWLEDVEQNRAALDIRAACGRSRTPTLLLHGTGDESVPFEEAQALEAAFDPAVGRLVAIEEAGHTFGARHPYEGTTADLERVVAETNGFLAGHLG
jgi:dienelactone hydrolase